MTHLPRSLLALSVFLAFGCQDGIVQPDADILLDHKGKPHGKPGDGGGNEDPSGFDGRFGFRIGYSRPFNGGPAPGVVNALGSTSTFIGASVSISNKATDVGYLQDQLGPICFPDLYESGVWTFTDGRAEFSFYARSADGSVSKSYVLALTGPPFESFKDTDSWPLLQEGGGSFFNATDWTLIPQGKGKKNPGCEGGSTFQADSEDPVRVGVAGGGSPDPHSVKVVSPFLYSPYNPLTATPVPVPTFSVFDHSPYDGLVINYLGVDVGADFGYDGSTFYDFAVDIGTEIVAAAGGKVIWVGNGPPFYCPSLGRVVTDQLFVAIEHEVPAVEGGFQPFATVYKRLESVAVVVGKIIDRGTVVGKSGNSGCTTLSALHFNVRVKHPGGVDFHTTYFRHRTDPYGASPTDPSDGVMHQLLWVDGQAPPLIPVIY